MVSLACLGSALSSRADVIAPGLYTLQNASVAGYSLTGTITLDSQGNVTASNLVYNNPNYRNTDLPYFNQVSSTSTYNGLSQSYLVSSANSGQVALFFNTQADASGFFDLCLGNAQCGTASGTVDPSTLQIYGFYNNASGTSNQGLSATNLSSGYLMSGMTAITPEPASFVMLGTGALGAIGLAGKRIKRPDKAAGRMPRAASTETAASNL